MGPSTDTVDAILAGQLVTDAVRALKCHLKDLKPARITLLFILSVNFV